MMNEHLRERLWGFMSDWNADKFEGYVDALMTEISYHVAELPDHQIEEALAVWHAKSWGSGAAEQRHAMRAAIMTALNLTRHTPS